MICNALEAACHVIDYYETTQKKNISIDYLNMLMFYIQADWIKKTGNPMFPEDFFARSRSGIPHCVEPENLIFTDGRDITSRNHNAKIKGYSDSIIRQMSVTCVDIAGNTVCRDYSSENFPEEFENEIHLIVDGLSKYSEDELHSSIRNTGLPRMGCIPKAEIREYFSWQKKEG